MLRIVDEHVSLIVKNVAGTRGVSANALKFRTCLGALERQF